MSSRYAALVNPYNGCYTSLAEKIINLERTKEKTTSSSVSDPFVTAIV